MLKQLDFIQLTLPETRLHSFSTVMRLQFSKVTVLAIILLLSLTGCRAAPPPSNIPPVVLKFACDETPTTADFQQFWTTFRAAVQTDDKDRLYALTARCEFTWWNWEHQRLQLRTREFLDTSYSGNLGAHDNPAINAALVFQTKQEFIDSYGIIFTADTKRHFLDGKVSETGSGRYDIRWRDDGLNSLSFRNVAGVGYKFTGKDWEP